MRTSAFPYSAAKDLEIRIVAHAGTQYLSPDDGRGRGSAADCADYTDLNRHNPRNPRLTPLSSHFVDRIDLQPHLGPPNLTRIHSGSDPLPAAGAIFQRDVPAVPATDDFAALHDAFGQGETHVRAEVIHSIDPASPSE